MTLTETRNFMERIKLHYQEFMIDNVKVEEWHRELKDYNIHEINDKFEEHLRNEQYGHQIPKIGFLTKYLIKEKEKTLNNASTIKISCSQCGEKMLLTEFDEHMEKCNSIEYLNEQSLRLFGKEIDKDAYRKLSQESFNNIYDKFLNKILEVSKDKEEKERINQILGANYEQY